MAKKELTKEELAALRLEIKAKTLELKDANKAARETNAVAVKAARELEKLRAKLPQKI